MDEYFKVLGGLMRVYTRHKSRSYGKGDANLIRNVLRHPASPVASPYKH